MGYQLFGWVRKVFIISLTDWEKMLQHYPATKIIMKSHSFVYEVWSDRYITLDIY